MEGKERLLGLKNGEMHGREGKRRGGEGKGREGKGRGCDKEVV